MPAPEQPDAIWERVRAELRREVADSTFHIWLSPLQLAAARDQTLFVTAPEHLRTLVRDRYLPRLVAAARCAFHPAAVVEIVDAQWEPSVTTERPPGAPSLSSGLNPKYTFEQFVIGETNRFAHGAALAVAELPGHAYNPLFIHGQPGLGKTHLMHAIGNFVRRHAPTLTVRYATVEEFTNEFVAAVRQKESMPAFKARFRRVDLLLLDDVQFLEAKVRTEEELFHTFNFLKESGRQLVMTSDRAPEQLTGLERRLGERFASGLVVNITPPNADVRRAILASRARIDGLAVSSELLAAIAATVTGSVRALEAALVQVVAYASLRAEPATPELALRLLRRLDTRRRGLPCGVAEIVGLTATEFGVSPADVIARDRRPAVVLARKVAMHLTRDLTGQSLPQIGKGFGARDHSTVFSALQSIEREIAGDPSLAAVVDTLREQLTNAD